MLIFYQIANIRNNIINLGQLGIGELQPGIDDNDLIFKFNTIHIFADLTNTPERKYADRRLG
ncbi:hypothetical protein D3C73_1667990 [compost metagenome]